MGNAEKAAKKPGWLQLFFFFLIGVYGGFVQVGVGYFLLAALVLVAGFDLVRANALKVWVVLLYTPFATPLLPCWFLSKMIRLIGLLDLPTQQEILLVPISHPIWPLKKVPVL